ncbi:MAG TPA: heavy-metal-associated domain-containing protein [Kofleriaceae bacterium]|nr:heavy-metal-associated domain-containing protein [Kofleriaceae bacterium]
MRILIIALSLSCSFLFAACETTRGEPAVDSPALAETTQPVAAAVVPEQAQPTASGEDSCGGGACGGGGSCSGSSCGCGAAMATRAPRNVPPDATWTEVRVKGMRCGGCEKRIEAALAGLEGVYDVDANHTNASVRIATAPSDRTVRDRVVPQIEALGFRTQ